MKKTAVVLSVIFVLGFSFRAQAHTFATDGDITVLLHTNPDDDPIVGQPASVLFQVTDSTNKYDSSKCDCSVSISEKNKVLFSESLLRIAGATIYDLTQAFTFPEKAVYQITVTGKPKVAGDFQSFKVTYDLRADRQTAVTTDKTTGPSKVWLILAGLVVFAVVIMSVIYFKGSNIKK